MRPGAHHRLHGIWLGKWGELWDEDDPRFGVLIRADLQGVTVRGHDKKKPVRKFGPWY